MCLVGMACKERKNPPVCECGKVEINKKEYLAMCIVPNIVTKNSVNKWIMENYTKNDMIYDNHFWIEYFNKNEWLPVEFDIIPAPGMHVIPEGKTIEIEMELYYFLTERFNHSKYRIIKSVSLGNIGYHLYAEFEIK
jgi:hypothetical protein